MGVPNRDQGGQLSTCAAVALGASIVIPISSTQVVPFSLLGQLIQDKSQLGVAVGGLSTANMAGVLMAFITIGPVAEIAGWRFVMLSAACWAALSLAPVFWLGGRVVPVSVMCGAEVSDNEPALVQFAGVDSQAALDQNDELDEPHSNMEGCDKPSEQTGISICDQGPDSSLDGSRTLLQ